VRGKVRRDAVSGNTPKKPAVQSIHCGFEVGRARKAKDTFAYRVFAGDFCMLKVIVTVPDSELELCNELSRGIALVSLHTSTKRTCIYIDTYS
jgi:hypothetical protein